MAHSRGAQLAARGWSTTVEPMAGAGRLGSWSKRGSMSAFSAVDDAPEPQRLIEFLDHAAQAESGIKHYSASVLSAG